MRRTRMLVSTIVASTLALTLTASASAAKHLDLSTPELGTLENGTETIGVGSFITGESNCDTQEGGALLNNIAAKDNVLFSEPEQAECVGPSGRSISNAAWAISMATSGKAILTASPAMTIDEPGPCVYDFSKLKGTFPTSGPVTIQGQATGKLDKTMSVISCVKKSTREFSYFLFATRGRINPQQIEAEVTR